ncbi:SOMA FERRITIN [Encephalitozoon cuniculi GB-M1]|uniref:Ferritin n=2 Tax=Encephalitozoon cuniculi TaxID=6035 RepID=Q8SRN5_ENCCU|nr:ferritin [Encephalitozoon cuniculi GB-M1]AGE95752.1 soma ferritin [Encephalitozoon cuniculi]KMV66034.1 ferritin [Encephalitozoon cuniculi EcunIII-L]UYI27732.1 ferritin [Encephalitozoon cuniculi]CAD25498.1 SOMA FERRITIN [Encephalitozoon cuniculi GB-M1]
MDPKTKQASSDEWNVEAGLLLSSQLLLEYNAYYFYSACAAHFSRSDVCLKGLASFFRKKSLDENAQAQKIIGFMNMRELDIEFRAIEAPDIKKYGKTSGVLKACKEFEQTVLSNISTISEIARKAGDGAIVQFLEDFIAEQVRSISELSDLCANCARCGDGGVGLFLFDQSLISQH